MVYHHFISYLYTLSAVFLVVFQRLILSSFCLFTISFGAELLLTRSMKDVHLFTVFYSDFSSFP